MDENRSFYQDSRRQVRGQIRLKVLEGGLNRRNPIPRSRLRPEVGGEGQRIREIEEISGFHGLFDRTRQNRRQSPRNRNGRPGVGKITEGSIHG